MKDRSVIKFLVPMFIFSLVLNFIMAGIFYNNYQNSYEMMFYYSKESVNKLAAIYYSAVEVRSEALNSSLICGLIAANEEVEALYQIRNGFFISSHTMNVIDDYYEEVSRIIQGLDLKNKKDDYSCG